LRYTESHSSAKYSLTAAVCVRPVRKIIINLFMSPLLKLQPVVYSLSTSKFHFLASPHG
jgi:hypothetical protein